MSSLIVIPIIFIVVLISQYVLLKYYDYKCGNCGNVFSPSLLAVMLTPHSLGRKRLTCPKCGETTWATRVRKAN